MFPCPQPSLFRPRWLALGGAVGLLALAGCRPPPAPFPAADSPAGAYAHIAVALAEGHPRELFAYVEDDAQWAAYTIRDERKRAIDRAERSYPKSELEALTTAWGVDASAPDGADVFVRLGEARGWFSRLRRDLSGVARTEVDGDRATIVTALGTRYPMHRRRGGIWGLTMFTAELTDDAKRATRDRARVEAGADDYDHAALKITNDGVTDAP